MAGSLSRALFSASCRSCAKTSIPHSSSPPGRRRGKLPSAKRVAAKSSSCLRFCLRREKRSPSLKALTLGLRQSFVVKSFVAKRRSGQARRAGRERLRLGHPRCSPSSPRKPLLSGDPLEVGPSGGGRGGCQGVPFLRRSFEKGFSLRPWAAACLWDRGGALATRR